jgi:hypothetical protein
VTSVFHCHLFLHWHTDDIANCHGSWPHTIGLGLTQQAIISDPHSAGVGHTAANQAPVLSTHSTSAATTDSKCCRNSCKNSDDGLPFQWQPFAPKNKLTTAQKKETLKDCSCRCGAASFTKHACQCTGDVGAKHAALLACMPLHMPAGACPAGMHHSPSQLVHHASMLQCAAPPATNLLAWAKARYCP